MEKRELLYEGKAKRLFKQGLGGLTLAYEEVLNRILNK